ncbi:hypothetical protein VNO77_39018 [Canavalia gladiata]|uniref:Uncharacterized protein n=1 Tax=Canavalia gladiata TaxID=3824 RepID=A0AAN9KBX0_CANGL
MGMLNQANLGVDIHNAHRAYTGSVDEGVVVGIGGDVGEVSEALREDFQSILMQYHKRDGVLWRVYLRKRKRRSFGVEMEGEVCWWIYVVEEEEIHVSSLTHTTHSLF